MNETISESTAAAAAQTLPPAAQIFQMAGGYVISKAIFAVAELAVADHLKDGPHTADEIAKATGTHAPSLYRLLRFLASLGFFVEEAEQRFSLTPLGAALQSDDPGCARSTARMIAGSGMWGGWGGFLHSVKTGETGFEKTFGQPIFDYLSTRPEEASVFNEAMIGIHGAEPPAVAAAYDFSGIQTLVDVGGGTGNLLTTVLAANPGLKGVLYDLPHVAAEAQSQIERKNLSDRCEIVSGSFFESVPSGGDAYMMSHIIHDWDEEKCVQILQNCRQAIPDDGRLLLVEMVVPPGNDFHPSKFLDLIMLTIPGGKERTEKEYAELFSKAGFSLTRVVPTASPVSVVEAQPI
jgi:hypothetical protein